MKNGNLSMSDLVKRGADALRAPPLVHAKSQMDGHSQCIDYFDDPPVHFKPRIFTRAP
jgi:hypothetical protein